HDLQHQEPDGVRRGNHELLRQPARLDRLQRHRLSRPRLVDLDELQPGHSAQDDSRGQEIHSLFLRRLEMMKPAMLILALFSTAAHADYSLICGEGRAKGAEKAEVALVQDNETLEMKFFVAGKALAKEEFVAKGATENKWYVTEFA